MQNRFRMILAGTALALSAYAVETSFWQQYDVGDYDKATIQRLALRSDGRLSLAPAFKEVYETSASYLWAVTEDSKGNVYAGGGAPGSNTAKLFQIDAAGKGKALAEIPGLAIHAIVVDKQDRVYAATSPDGKIYRLNGDKPEVFYDPRTKYIWAMAFSSRGDLFVATGDRGEIHKVSPSGQGSVFFQTEETHARSLAIDSQDNLIVGTEPGGLVLRVSAGGEGFVLYQSSKREVSAVAVGKDGKVYAAAVGNKTPSSLPAVTPVAAPPPAPAPAGNAITMARAQTAPPPTFGSPAPSISGGSEVYRINPDTSPQRVWQHATEIVYSIGFDGEGHVLIGTGNKGRIYRLDSDRLHTLLVSSTSTQVTGFHASKRGPVFAIAGNLGKVFQMGPGLEKDGTVESEVLDASAFSYWGRARYEGAEQGGTIAVDTRSGNLDRPQKNWSAWTPVPLQSRAGRIGSPAARFLQYRVKLSAASNGSSPNVSLMELAYLTKNVAPAVEEIESTPANYRFPQPSSSLTPSQTLTLSPIGQRKRSSSGLSLDSGSATLNRAKGWIGARWKANDDNGDTLTFKVEIRAVGEQTWRLLKDNVKERYHSWDSTAFADGEYQVRVTASDASSNPPDQALMASLEGEPFLIDNTSPEISDAAVQADAAGKTLTIRWKAKDARSVIEKAEYSLNGGEWVFAQPVTRLADSLELVYEVKTEKPAGDEVTVAIRVSDEFENQAVAKTGLRR